MVQLAADLRANYTPPVGTLPPGLVWLVGAADPVDGVAGTGAGVAPVGSRFTNTTTGKEFVNTGSTASPAWTAVGSAILSGAGAPDSGAGGDEAAQGATYYDTNFDPPVPYTQLSADPADPKWAPLVLGDVTA